MAGIGNEGALHNPKGGKDKRLKRKLAARGQLLREWRILAGHSMISLAGRLGVHWNTIGNWEDGGTIPSSSIATLVRMGWPQNQANLNLNG